MMTNTEKIKVGIITHYYRSNNLGGLLQSYATQKILESNGYQAKQIAYSLESSQPLKKKSIVLKLATIPKRILIKIINKVQGESNLELLNKRAKKNYSFMDSIPHTSCCDATNVFGVSKEFDIFITGSDQVWNPNCFRPAFFLDFVADNIPKISYAASMSATKLMDEEKTVLKPLIERFDFISVREDSAKNLIGQMCDNEITVTLDPTMLLKKSEWNKIVVKPQIDGNYIFVYLLGSSKKHREYIRRIAKKLDLKIVNIPHINMIFEKNDVDFSDIEMDDAGPAEFLGLIKNASMIITDSFHGCVFSTIYEKNFWALKRHKDTDTANMNSRLYTLFDNLGIENRFLENIDITDKEALLNPINYEVVNEKLDSLRQDSMDWLKNALDESVKKN